MNIFQVNKKTDFFILTLLVFLFSSATAALAQAGRGGINGLVSDPSGAVIPGAKVTARQPRHRSLPIHRHHLLWTLLLCLAQPRQLPGGCRLQGI